MAIKILHDAAGNEIRVDDDVSLLGPRPKASADSRHDHRFQPIRDPYGDRQRALERTARQTSGYGNGDPTGTVDDPDWKAQHWGKK
jgi:hypothetical protein